jgi:hypothetical protein
MPLSKCLENKLSAFFTVERFPFSTKSEKESNLEVDVCLTQLLSALYLIQEIKFVLCGS